MHHKVATELVKTLPEEVKRQLEYLPYRTVKKNRGGLLRDAIRRHWTPPDDYLEFQKRQLEQQESQERLQRRKAEEAKAAARQKNEEELKRAYFDYLKRREAQLQKDQPKAYNHFLKDTAAKRAAVQNDPCSYREFICSEISRFLPDSRHRYINVTSRCEASQIHLGERQAKRAIVAVASKLLLRTRREMVLI